LQQIQFVRFQNNMISSFVTDKQQMEEYTGREQYASWQSKQAEV